MFGAVHNTNFKSSDSTVCGQEATQEGRLYCWLSTIIWTVVIQTHGPPVYIMRPAATFLNCVYPIKLTQYRRQFGTPLTVTFPRASSVHPLLLHFHVRPANRPTITVWPFAIECPDLHYVSRTVIWVDQSKDGKTRRAFEFWRNGSWWT